MVTALRAPCGVLRDSFVAQPCKSRINIFKLYSPLPFRFMGHKEGPRWHNGLTEVCKVMEQGDEINLSSPVRLFPPEISGSSQIISGVLEHRVEQADFCTGISVGFALFQAGVASWQPPPDVFKRWGSSQASCAASSLCPAMSCNVLRRPWAAGPVFCPSCVPRVPQQELGAGQGTARALLPVLQRWKPHPFPACAVFWAQSPGRARCFALAV